MSDVVAFNSQIVKLLRLGLPIVIGEMSNRHEIEAFLSDIDARIVDTNSDASRLGVPITDDQKLPADYRNALQCWCRGGSLNRSVQPLYEIGFLEREMRWGVAKYLSWVLLMIVLVVLGMYLLTSKVYPELRGMYEISELKTTTSLKFVQSLGEWSTVVFALTCSTVAALFFVWLTVPTWLTYLLPINRSIVATIRSAQQLELCCDTEGARNKNSNDIVRSIVMRESAESSFRVSQRWLTLIGACLFCGLLVLGYALCLFWPIVELLHQMSQG